MKEMMFGKIKENHIEGLEYWARGRRDFETQSKSIKLEFSKRLVQQGTRF